MFLDQKNLKYEKRGRITKRVKYAHSEMLSFMSQKILSKSRWKIDKFGVRLKFAVKTIDFFGTTFHYGNTKIINVNSEGEKTEVNPTIVLDQG